jgi:hypothetical protein
MKAVTTFLLSVFSVPVLAAAADARWVNEDPYAGYYLGTFQTRFVKGVAEAQIRSLGGGSYDGFIALKSEKDGVESIVTVGVITEFQPQPGGTTIIGAQHPNNRASARDNPDSRLQFVSMTLNGELTPGKLTGDIQLPVARPGESTFTMNRVKAPASVTLGAEPPEGAMVIFDGKDRGQWKEAKWKIVEGALEVGEGNLTTKQSLTNFLLHVEFRTPAMPGSRGQDRGNSGVYLRSVFEVQVLDSFGLFPLADNDCGGIYKVAAPHVNAVNACLPPGEWQTYDITFREGDEKTFRLPEITVVHNGRTVIDRVKIPNDLVVNGTGGGEVDGGFLLLQNHGNPVQYRNIWALPID